MIRKSSKSLTRHIKAMRGYRPLGSEEYVFFRHAFDPIPSEEGLSKNDDIALVQWAGGAAVARVHNVKRGLWVTSVRLNRAVRKHGKLIKYMAQVGKGEQILENLEEIFYFVCLPPQVDAVQDTLKRLKALSDWVAQILVEEGRQSHQQSLRLHEEQLRKRPKRLPFESGSVDHHKNQQEVTLRLLREQWPQLSKAMNDCSTAKSDPEKREMRRRLWLAYIADYSGIHGHRPTIRKGEEAELWQHDELIKFMYTALSGPKGRVDTISWQLANGWIEKDYYRMNESQLETAFARDWKYQRTIKGNTLAKRARRLGLISALKRGRPELHKFTDCSCDNADTPKDTRPDF